MYKSEIPESTRNALLEKVRRHQYGKYLLRMDIQKIRGFSNKEIRFDFPVTALIGPNGSGKSSILGAAACAYKSIKPSTFFPKSAIGDRSMSDWGAMYELIDKKINPKGTIKRTSSFKRARWNREALDRIDTLFFGIERTVPAGEKNIFKQLAKSTYLHNKEINTIEESVAKQVEHILGKQVSEYKSTDYGDNEKFLIGSNNGSEYSEFHFGAGESSIIRMVQRIECAPDNSLILIEEIENGLHPIAIARMVEYLIDVADRKAIQTIFTTHSDYALLPLPNDAIWACIDGELHQGKLSVESLRAISGRIDKKLAIFVEDNFAKHWVEAILRRNLTDCHELFEVHAVNGDGNAVKIHKTHQINPSITSKSLCIIDGDSNQESDENSIIRLPGKQPEREVFNCVYKNIDSDIAKLTVACHLQIDEQNSFKKILDEISKSNRDSHFIFTQIGEKVGLKPEAIIRSAFLEYWIQYNQPFCKELSEKVRLLLDA